MITVMFFESLEEALNYTELDNCEICHGTRGGVLGNENRVNGKVLCDYCNAENMK